MHMAQYDAVNKRLDFNISETLTQSLARFRQEAQDQQDQQGAPNQHIDFGSELSSLARSGFCLGMFPCQLFLSNLRRPLITPRYSLTGHMTHLMAHLQLS